MGAVLAVIMIVYIAITAKRKSSSIQSNTASKGTTGQITNSVIATEKPSSDIFPLKRGSNNLAVKFLKQCLNYIAIKRGVSGVNLILTTDANVFGIATENALYKLYTTKIVDKDLAKRIARDADVPEADAIINTFS